MKTARRPLIIILALLFIFSPISFSDVFVYSQEEGYEEIDGYQEWNQDRTITGIVNINPDATVVVRKGVTITFDHGVMNIEGNLIASGTVKSPVIFKKKEGTGNYSMTVTSSGKLTMRNVDMSGGGYSAYVLRKKSIFNNALAYMEGGIQVEGGWLDVGGSSFHDNEVAISIANMNFDRIRVNRSKFFNNTSFDVYYFGNSGDLIDFRYNWWGNPDGPPEFCYEPGECYHEKFKDDVNVSGWLEKENFHDPVIIIPGILGSQKKNGAWTIDPVFHTYDNLYQEFSDNGYVPEKDLFEFPYEWRDSNVDNAKLLQAKIEDIKEKNHWPKVDIVAHSMGGLLAREYIESEYYQNDVDQLVTLGTPHNGAPEAYIKWEGDEWFFSSISDHYVKNIIGQEAKEGGYADIFDYIHQRPISSLQELLPVYDYLQDVRNNYEYKKYPSGYPQNEFLEKLNSKDKKNKLSNVEFDKIIGKLENNNITISGFKAITADMGKWWEHGYPHGFEIPILGDRGMIYGDGDKTVPLSSARSENIPADYALEIKSDHRSLPTNAQKDVLEILTGIRPTIENRDSLIKDILFVSVFSPIDIQVVDKNGKRVGKNFSTGGEYNEIPGAYYSGSNTKNEFLTIPNPIDGEYKILVQGTGEGEYNIKASKIAENENIAEEAIESTAEISGNAVVGMREEKTIVVKNGEVTAGVQDKIPPLVKIISPESKTYGNDNILEIKYDISDDVSALDKMKKEVLFDGNAMNTEKIDLSLEHLGTHGVSVTATDEAGNVGEDKIEFSSSADITSIISNVGHYFDLHLITTPATKNYLKARLEIIKGELHTVDVLEKSSLPKVAKERFMELLRKMANQDINSLINQIEKEKNLKKTTTLEIRELLIESLEEIKI